MTLLLSVAMLWACSKNLYQSQNGQDTVIKTDNRELEKFMEQGFEKPLNTSRTSASEIIRTARKYLGVPHCMGGTTFNCMDCSGLLFTTFGEHGIEVPRSSEEQARYGRYIGNRSELQRGDLVFFIRSYKTSKYITHSGIYLGNNEFIHASSSQGVTTTSLSNSWWSERFIFGTRIF
ncbi:C40 family peptidase [Geofilum rubicundum]|uniref:C40 family peptidase n=1 Tax=Geofilum rubicundum TaxID=472113 RepID=UPI001D0EA39A|nr:C40 family peptidase [Geofilum rubicundum]